MANTSRSSSPSSPRRAHRRDGRSGGWAGALLATCAVLLGYCAEAQPQLRQTIRAATFSATSRDAPTTTTAPAVVDSVTPTEDAIAPRDAGLVEASRKYRKKKKKHEKKKGHKMEHHGHTPAPACVQMSIKSNPYPDTPTPYIPPFSETPDIGKVTAPCSTSSECCEPMICSTKYVPEEAEVIIDNYFDDPDTTCSITVPVTGRVPNYSPIKTCCFEMRTTCYYGCYVDVTNFTLMPGLDWPSNIKQSGIEFDEFDSGIVYNFNSSSDAAQLLRNELACMCCTGELLFTFTFDVGGVPENFANYCNAVPRESRGGAALEIPYKGCCGETDPGRCPGPGGNP